MKRAATAVLTCAFGCFLAACEPTVIIGDDLLDIVVTGAINCDEPCRSSIEISAVADYGQTKIELLNQKPQIKDGKFILTHEKRVIGYKKSEIAEWNKRIVVSAKAKGCHPYAREYALIALPLNEKRQILVDLGEINLKCSGK